MSTQFLHQETRYILKKAHLSPVDLRCACHTQLDDTYDLEGKHANYQWGQVSYN